MKHFIKMILGGLCYSYFLHIMSSPPRKNKFNHWVLSWAGYYAYNNGWRRE